MYPNKYLNKMASKAICWIHVQRYNLQPTETKKKATDQFKLFCLVLKTKTAVIIKHISVAQLAANICFNNSQEMTYTKSVVRLCISFWRTNKIRRHSVLMSKAGQEAWLNLWDAPADVLTTLMLMEMIPLKWNYPFIKGMPLMLKISGYISSPCPWVFHSLKPMNRNKTKMTEIHRKWEVMCQNKPQDKCNIKELEGVLYG